MYRSMRVTGTKALCLAVALAFSFSIPVVEAKSDNANERAKGNSETLMPVTGSPNDAGYEAAKNAIEESLKAPKGPSPLELAGAFFLRNSQDAGRVTPQKGDPKTSFSQSENKQHAKGKSGTHTGSPQRMYNLSNWISNSTTYEGSNVITYYFYDPNSNNPYNVVKVVVDSSVNEVLSITGYKTTVTQRTVQPDLTGSTLTFSAYRSDGSLAYELYSTTPDSDGVFTETKLQYDTTGTYWYYSQTLVQPLDPGRVKL